MAELVDDLNAQLDILGLSEELEFRNDGERLLVTTKRGGNAVYLSVYGTKGGLLGFKDENIEAYGKIFPMRLAIQTM